MIAFGFERSEPIPIDVDVLPGAAPAVPPVVAHKSRTQRVHREVLQPRVERRTDLKTSVVERTLAVFAVQQPADFFDEVVGIFRLDAERSHLGDERFDYRSARLVTRDVAVLRHLADDPVPAFERRGFVEAWIVVARRLGQRGEERRLGDVELIERFAEVIERRGGNTVRILAEKNLVQVKLEDLGLGIGRIDAHGEDRFLDLAREALLAVEQKVLGHLLRDRGRAFEPLVLQHVEDVLDGCTRNAARINAGVAEEILVLGRGEGVDHEFRNKGDGHEYAPFARVFAQQGTVSGVNARRDGRLIVLECFDARQISGGGIDVHGERRRRRQYDGEEREPRCKNYSTQADLPFSTA